MRQVTPGKWLVAVYRELSDDGFIITAFFDPEASGAREAEAGVAVIDIGKFLKIVPTLRQSPKGRLCSTYDEEADTLYINFKRPSVATDSDLTDDDVIVRYEGDEVVGLTILHASKR